MFWDLNFKRTYLYLHADDCVNEVQEEQIHAGRAPHSTYRLWIFGFILFLLNYTNENQYLTHNGFDDYAIIALLLIVMYYFVIDCRYEQVPRCYNKSMCITKTIMFVLLHGLYKFYHWQSM